MKIDVRFERTDTQVIVIPTFFVNYGGSDYTYHVFSVCFAWLIFGIAIEVEIRRKIK